MEGRERYLFSPGIIKARRRMIRRKHRKRPIRQPLPNPLLIPRILPQRRRTNTLRALEPTRFLTDPPHLLPIQ